MLSASDPFLRCSPLLSYLLNKTIIYWEDNGFLKNPLLKECSPVVSKIITLERAPGSEIITRAEKVVLSLSPFRGRTHMYVWAGFSETSVHCYSENVEDVDCMHIGALSTISCLACEMQNIHSGRSGERAEGRSWCGSEPFRFILWLLLECCSHSAKWICFSINSCLHVHTCIRSFSASI